MAYPYDLPAISLSNIWNSGSYTPEEVVKYIRDNYTPVNKTSMRNSVGYQISSVQNYVNSHYLGRFRTPVNSGYIQNLYSSGFFRVTGTGLDYRQYMYPYGNFIEDLGYGYVNLSMTIASGFSIAEDGPLYYKSTLDESGLLVYKSQTDRSYPSYLNVGYNKISMTDDDSATEAFISHATHGTLELSADQLLKVSAPKTRLTATSSPVTALKVASGIVGLSSTEPRRINTNIDYRNNVSMLYFGVSRGDGTTESDNWIPANYYSPVSGWPIMSGDLVSAYWISYGGTGPQYTTLPVHLQSDSVDTLTWNIVIAPMNSTLIGTNLLEQPVLYRYVLLEG